MSTGKGIIVMVILLILLFVIKSCDDDTNSELINNKVHSIGGEVIDIDEKCIFSDTPFVLNGKTDRIYQFIYHINGEQKIGWFRSGAFNNDWILDYQKD